VDRKWLFEGSRRTLSLPHVGGFVWNGASTDQRICCIHDGDNWKDNDIKWWEWRNGASDSYDIMDDNDDYSNVDNSTHLVNIGIWCDDVDDCDEDGNVDDNNDDDNVDDNDKDDNVDVNDDDDNDEDDIMIMIKMTMMKMECWWKWCWLRLQCWGW